ncbi:MAG: hypothetical protein N5P05_001553 [Chroococcopsis gigantea SAG 12.99]|jgi:hypothetical protein|nr:hypothetical protein [Chroococcopsis gigantea SAG 12.99]
MSGCALSPGVAFTGEKYHHETMLTSKLDFEFGNIRGSKTLIVHQGY